MNHQKTAHRIGDVSFRNHATGQMTLWRCNPPLAEHEYVVSSSTRTLGGKAETLIFPANSSGSMTDKHELAGMKGVLDPQTVFEDVGYTLS